MRLAGHRGDITPTRSARIGAWESTLSGIGWPLILFVSLAAVLIGARFAFLQTFAEFWTGGLLDLPKLLLRSILYQARELLVCLGLAVMLWAVLARVRQKAIRALAVAIVGFLAVAVAALNVTSGATLPMLGSSLTSGMIIYSDMLASEHGRIALSSWVPRETIVALTASLALAILASGAILRWRVARGFALLAVIGLVSATSVFLLLDRDSASIRKESATSVFLGSLRSLDDRTLVGGSTPVDPYAGGSPLESPIPAGQIAGKIENVIVVVVESAGARYFDDYGGEYSITPYLTALAGQSLRGERVYANAASSYYSMISLLSGRQLEVSIGPRVPPSPLLPAILANAGMRTAFFHSSDLRPARTDRMLIDAGFQTVADFRDRQCDARLIDDTSQFHSQGTLDRCTFAQMKNWIAGSDQPFFAMLWTFQSHFNYFVEEGNALPKLGPGEFAGEPHRAANKARYLAALAETDRQIGQLVQFLRKAGQADSTLIVVTGDHGESFADHGQFGHGGHLYESAARVPLYFIAPGLAPGGTFGRLTSHVDVAPTIIDLLGLDVPQGWDGQSLVRAGGARPAIFSAPFARMQAGYRLGDRKVIGWLLEDRAEVYDIAADPGEEHDLAAGDRAIQKAELDRLRSWIAYLSARANRN